MLWSSACAVGPALPEAIGEAAAEAKRGLAGEAADVAFVFVSADHATRAGEVPARVRDVLGPGVLVVGCTAGGVIGGGRELERRGAVSVLAGRLPGVTLRLFHVEEAALPDPDAPPSAWHALAGVPAGESPRFVLVADPLTFPVEALLGGLDFAYPGAPKVGGLASGAARRGAQVLFAGDAAVGSGAVGLALTGDVDLVPAVAQGCRGFGPVLRITACEGNLLRSLDGVPALETVRTVLAAAPERDRALARTALFLGVESDPFAAEGEPPWLVRNVLGIERDGQALVVGELLRPGRRVRFHVRDRVTSAEDLDRTLEAAGSGRAGTPRGALLFSCLGRGMNLDGVPDHDTRALHRRWPSVPVGGFFCSGEIGPVGGTTYVHGYTSSFGLFAPREKGA
jgi:small ligand-binding sensory domain FIST